ncbi:hypothetical protein [Patulibacter sp.]|uniref:hypothetical protein n=1 Tax=Patulibacter sp. TaxID=1912859 RepID=UPI002723027F|nr:hypothetical protein [Patulibacter sp.]MDO9410777.1 hypothetical protein [Patulibacter sp.]
MNPHEPLPDDDLDRVAEWVAHQRPAPPVELERRGAVLVRLAVHERATRHRAGVLLSTGSVALVAAVAIAVLGG